MLGHVQRYPGFERSVAVGGKHRTGRNNYGTLENSISFTNEKLQTVEMQVRTGKILSFSRQFPPVLRLDHLTFRPPFQTQLQIEP